MKELSLLSCRLDRRYDIHEQLGRGSYAEIYLATDTLASPHSPHRTVVVKALNVFLQDDLDEALERTLVENFQNEAIALDRVRHPNIISRIGHGTARDLNGTVFHYLVLEYMSGGDLQALVRREKPSLDRALDFVEQVCAGLGHAHEKGIIHRDIKPQNLLLNGDHSTVKIADFGVARVTVSDAPITRVGTNIYAPPEHSPMHVGRGNEMRLTPAADIYSLAKSAYAIITGESPRSFANDSVVSLPDSCLGEPWCDPLLKVLKHATAEDPAARPQSVEEFWSDLLIVREFVGEKGTVLREQRTDAPQPHVSRGYSPVAPVQPDFELIPTRNSARLSHIAAEPPAKKFPAMQASLSARARVNEAPVPAASVKPAANAAVPVKRSGRSLKRLVTMVLVLIAFTGILYGTASYIRGRNLLSGIANPFRTQMGVANTDIYLRPSPNTDSDPIGLVTKNSKVRIVSSQNNWYQVDIVEQGRARQGANNVTRGWLNGKYLDLQDN